MRPNSLSHMKNAVTDARWLKVSPGPLAREEATVAMASDADARSTKFQKLEK